MGKLHMFNSIPLVDQRRIMPELPGKWLCGSICLARLIHIIACVEVERAAALLRSIAKGRQIARAEAVEDTIVFSGTTHADFVTIYNDSEE